MKGSYYSIAINEMLFLESVENTTYWNPIVILAHQVTEMLLKSVLDTIGCMDGFLYTHDLKSIYDKIGESYSGIVLNEQDLVHLSECFLKAQYPNDGYVIFSKEQCDTCVMIMYKVLEKVDAFREGLRAPVYRTGTVLHNNLWMV